MDETAEPRRNELERWCTETGRDYVAGDWIFDRDRCCWTDGAGVRVSPAGRPWSGAEE